MYLLGAHPLGKDPMKHATDTHQELTKAHRKVPKAHQALTT